MQKKKQHLVPRSYLENFTDSNGKIFVLNKSLKIFSTKPEKILTDNHFYTIKLSDGKGSFIVEDSLANIEGAFAELFKKKISQRKSLTPEEKALAAVFIASMLMRTKSRRNSIQKFFDEALGFMEQIRRLPEENKKMLASMPRGDGPTISYKEMLEASKDIPSVHSVSIMDNLTEISQIIFAMKWGILIPESTKDYFITSDNPCVMLNPTVLKKFGPNSFGSQPGLDQKHVELTLPLSSSMTLLVGWLLDNQEYTPISSKMIDNLNNRIIMYADKILAKSDQKLRDIITKTKEKQSKLNSSKS